MNLENLASDRRIIFLISGFLQHKLTVDELAELEYWKQLSTENLMLFNSITHNHQPNIELWSTEKADLSFSKLEEKISRYNKLKIWRYIGTAAAIILITFSAILLWEGNNFTKNNKSEYTKAVDIKGGQGTAFLLTANGKKIALRQNKSNIIIGKDKISYKDGAIINGFNKKEIRTELLTAVTTKGTTYQITLSDGTKVWLNADSRLSFPSSFEKTTKREVTLTGEGYFIVKHIALKPFLVHTNRTIIEDLGTEFNVMDYTQDEVSKTTLLEGSLRTLLKNNEEHKGIILTPGQQTLAIGQQLTVAKADTEQETAWKNGYFRFNNESLTSVMEQIARWYDIELVYESKLVEERLYGSISRSKSLYEVLRMLEKTENIRFYLEGRRLTVKKAP